MPLCRPACGVLSCKPNTNTVPRRWHVVPIAATAWRGFRSTRPHSAEVVPLRKQLKDDSRVARKEKGTHIDTADLTASQWKLTVGIEIHAQLNCSQKLFSGAPGDNDAQPNKQVAAFDLAVPGSQPRLQLATLIPALRAAIALGCSINRVSRFDRKHYFYHDQPAGYQITQYYEPFAMDGSLLLSQENGLLESDGNELVIGIKQIQMEQDTAKTQEQEDGTSLIDFSRSGQPLIEIISLPQIHSPEAAVAFVRKVQAILFAVDSVTSGMEVGGLRADVNVSVRRVNQESQGHSYGGIERLGQRTEIKNLSSFKAVEDAIKAERNRQINLLEAGGEILGETRGWSASRPGETRRLRGKEGEVDYRYMPDPDIAPIYVAEDVITHLRRTLPPTPDQLVARLVHQYGLSIVDAKALLALNDGQRLIYFQDVVDQLQSMTEARAENVGKITGNWVLHELGSLLSTHEVLWTPTLVPATSLARIIRLQLSQKITGSTAKRVLRIVFDGNNSPVDDIVTQSNLWFEQMNDAEYHSLARQIIENNAAIVDEIRLKAKQGKIKFLVGQMMRKGDRNRMEAPKAESVLREIILG